MSMPLKNSFSDMLPEITAWRRDIHAHPELLFDTHRTSKLVEDKLKEFGCDEVVYGLGHTGVVGVIHGQKTHSGKTIGLRADMDALPIQEQTGLDYASKTEGLMHACGHDGHTAMLLGAVKYLTETRNFDGTAVVIFQPAEEGGGGGKVMVEDGLMERFSIDEIYGMHNWPGLPIGSFAIRSGPFFAAADEFKIVVEGQGGHAASPHTCIDTTLVAAQIIIALQSVISRTVNPAKQAVLSVCVFETNSQAHNVIPSLVKMKGTVRAFDTDVQSQILSCMTKLVEGTAAAYGAKATLTYKTGYPPMVNHDDQTAFAAEVAKDVIGDCNTDHPPLMVAEDFAFMTKERPGAYILVGNGENCAPLHHPEYNFNDEAIPVGCSWWVELIEKRLPVEKGASLSHG